MFDGSIMPPNNIPSEEFVLGCVINNPDVEVFEHLKADDFYESKHQIIFNAFLELRENSKHIDTLTTVEQLNRMKSDISPLEISNLASAVFTTVGLDHHINEVRSASVCRKLIRVGSEIASIGQKSHDYENALGQAEILLHSLRDNQPGNLRKIDETINSFLAKLESTDIEIGLHSNILLSVDQKVGGFHPGNLIVIAGSPGDGKTSLGLTYAAETAAKGKPVLFITLEMTDEELTARLISMRAEVSTKNMRLKTISQTQREKIIDVTGPISKKELWFDTRSRTIQDVRACARRFSNEHGISMLVIDYLQLMRGDGENRELQLSSITRGLKELAVELNIPILILSQYNRQKAHRENKRPQLSDLRGSGAIEQDADVVMFIHHPEDEASSFVIVGKNRHGETGDVEVNFIRPYTRFEEWKGLT